MLTPARLAVVADCGYGIEAASLAEETQPDLVLVAVEEPLPRAIQTIKAVRDIRPGAPVIAYSSVTDLRVVRQAMQAGVNDILASPLKPGELLASIETAMAGSEEEEERIRPENNGRKKSAGTVLTVFGAKGGIGKTTIATNLAAAIARDSENSVLVIDLDTRFGDVAILLDVEPRHTVAELAAQVSTLDRESFRSALIRHDSGAYVLPSPKHPKEWQRIEAEQIKDLVRMAARMFDYVILDTPGAFNDIVGTAIQVATEVLVITSVDMASIKDTSFILDLLDAESFPDERLLLTVNHANGANTIRAHDIERVLRKTAYWEIPHDSAVTLATQVGQPVVLAKPRSRAARSFAGLAEKITGTPVAVKEEQRGIIRRLIPALGRA
jgi:pilus assembly protein CpaE